MSLDVDFNWTLTESMEKFLKIEDIERSEVYEF